MPYVTTGEHGEISDLRIISNNAVPPQSGNYTHIVYKPRDGDARVKCARRDIYNEPGKEALWAVVETYLVNTTWISKMSWKNDTNAQQQYVVEYKTELAITEGEEVNKGYSVISAYHGLSVTIGQQTKVFETKGHQNQKGCRDHPAPLAGHILPKEIQVQGLDVLRP